MGLWRHVGRGLSTLLRSDAAERDLSDEVSHYLEEEIAALTAGGVPPEEARRRVRLAHGDSLSIREEVRAYGWEQSVESLVRDLTYAARRLRRSPGFTVVTTATLALGIGAATAIFSAARPVLFDPLDYPDGDQLVSIADRGPEGARIPVTFGTYRELAIRAHALSSLAVLRPWQPTLTGAGDPERLEGQRVSADYFRLLGVAPALGPGFEAAGDRVGGPRVAILSDGLWRRRFGSDSTIVGREVRLDDVAHTVVGVMPPGFVNVTRPSAGVWSLLQYDASLPTFDGREWGHHLDMVGRLEAGVDLETARRELDGLAARPLPELARPPWASLEGGLDMRPLKDEVTSRARPVLLALTGAVALLLFIACVNVAGLCLTRGARRGSELSLRLALGAARRRVVRTLLMESVLVAGLAAAVGLMLAGAGVRGLAAMIPSEVRPTAPVGLEWSVFGWSVLLSSVVLIGVGMLPAVRALVGDGPEEPRVSSARSPSRHGRSRRAFVVVEVALALVLLVGAGLMLRTTQGLFSVPPGFATDERVVLQVQVATAELQTSEGAHRFFSQVLDAVVQIPGVLSAAWTSQLPLTGDQDRYGVRREDQPSTEGFGAYRYAVSPEYREAMGIPLLQGRFLGDLDGADAPPSVVVSASLAREAFGSTTGALGHRIHVGPTDRVPYEIVGVVGDVRQLSLEASEGGAVYVTAEQWHFADLARWLVVHTRRDSGEVVAAVREAVRSVDGDQPVVRTDTLADLVTRSEARRRFALFMLEAFAAFALLLAGMGLYGVLASSVAERTREIGIRAALGASRDRILRLIVREGLALTAAGVVLGLGAAALASEAIATLLYGVSRLDPMTYGGVALLMVGVATLASWIPAHRAARVDPAVTLKGE